MAIKIETGINIPPRGQSPKSRKYPWREMRIGQSFCIHSEQPARAALQARLVNAAYNIHQRTTMRFVTRRVVDGVRVWRVK